MSNKKIVSLIFCLFLTVSLNACSPAEEKPTDNTQTTTEKPAADMETKSTEKTTETTNSAEEEVDVDEDAFEEEDVADEQESLKSAAGWTPEIEKSLAKTFSDACSADANMGKALEMVKKAEKKAEFWGFLGKKNVEGWKEVFPDMKTLHATSKEDAKK